MCKTLTIISLLTLAVGGQIPAADVVLENDRVRLVIGADAQWQALVDKVTSRDYYAAGKKIPLATVRVGNRSCPANHASLADGRLALKFDGCDTECVYQVTPNPDWIAFQLQRISGARPSHLTVFSVGVTLTNRVGPVLNAAWNDQYAICLRGINLQTHGQAARRRDFVELMASSQDEPGPKLEGSGVALLAAPPGELRAALGRLAAAYDLPRNEADGIASHDLPIARQSYWFLNFAENEVDKVIECCRRTGFRQVMLGSSAWCTQVGHYTFNTTRYPDGLESLRRTVAKLHQAGILVGMHTFASKISKTDAYVTPVPDRRFVVSRTATLDGDIGANDTTIRTRTDLSQWPGSPVCKQKFWEGNVTKHQEVVINDEIISYNRIGPDGKWDTFEGCRRGAWKTRAAAHKAGTECRQYAVDGGINGYIVDLDSTLFDETSSRLAEIFNTCQFDMVYFDGSEDVDHRRYSYYSAKAHAVPMRKFTKRPLIHQGGGFVNELWHSFTRDATIDQYPGTYLALIAWGGRLQKWPTCKDHIERSVNRVLRCADDMMPGELGWFGINPRKGNYDGLQYDEIEYLMAKSLALNAPISLQTGFVQMDAHPLTPDILEIVRVYEELRLSGRTPPQVVAELGKKGKDFVLLPASAGAPEFVAVQTLSKVAGTHDLRAFVGSHGADTISTLWHYFGKKGKLTLNTTQLEVRDVKGNAVPVAKAAGKTTIPMDHRRLTLRFTGVELKAARILLATARCEDTLQVQIEKDVAYLAPDRQEKGDLYLPDNPKKLRCPAVLIIHGGGWSGGDKGAAREINIGTTLAANGYVCFSINYVLATKERGPVWPQNLYDCKTAVRWLRKNADRLCIDPDHIGVIGGSAGGHLAAMVALTGPESGLDPSGPYGEYSCRVQAVVDLYGPADLVTWLPDRTGLGMLPASRAEKPELYRLASPGTHADKNDPPVLILQGTVDRTVPTEQSQRLADALKKAGAQHELVIIEGAPHSFHLQPKQRDLRPLVLGFFDRYLKPRAAK